VALRLHWIVLKGFDLGQELFVEQSQPLLLLEDVLAVESHPFSFMVRLRLLFLYLLFHLIEHLKELIFALCGYYTPEMGSCCDEEPESSVVHG